MLSKEDQVGKRTKPKRGKANKISKHIKEAVTKRDAKNVGQNKCACCGTYTMYLNAHHIQITGSGEANHALYNLIMLGDYCCHREIHDNPDNVILRQKVYDYMIGMYPESIGHLQEQLFGKYERKGF